MTRSVVALLAMLALGSALAGCSGTKPFWQTDPAAGQVAGEAADRSIEGPLTLARLAEQRGKTVEAERLYRAILERSPDNPVIYHRLAIMQSRNSRFEEANEYFDRALQLKPNDPTLLCDAGYCQYLQQRVDLAETLYRDALEIDPRHEAATNNLALLLAEKGDDRSAFALFRQTGTEAEAHANMGFVYSRRGELQKAKAAYNRALSIDPQMIVAAEAMVQLAQFERQSRSIAARSQASREAWAEYESQPSHEGSVVESQVQFVESEAAATPPGEAAQAASWHSDPASAPQVIDSRFDDTYAAPEPADAWHGDAAFVSDSPEAWNTDLNLAPDPADAWQTAPLPEY